MPSLFHRLTSAAATSFSSPTRHRPRRESERRAGCTRLGIDRLEGRRVLDVAGVLSIGGTVGGQFIASDGDIVSVFITGTRGTATFNDGAGVADFDAGFGSIVITGASTDFQITFLCDPLGDGVVNLGDIATRNVIRGVNTVPVAESDPPVSYVLTSFRGVNFSRGGGLFVDVVTGDNGDDIGIELTGGLIAGATIGIRDTLDAGMLLGAGPDASRGATADGRVFIQAATTDSFIIVGRSGSPGGRNAKLQIIGGGDDFDAVVVFEQAFAGVVDVAGNTGGNWIFTRGVRPGARLQASTWNGSNGPFTGVSVFGNFGGTLVSTDDNAGEVTLTVEGDVTKTARINAATSLDAVVTGSIAPRTTITATEAQVEVGGSVSGTISMTEGLFLAVGRDVSGTIQSPDGDILMNVGGSVRKGSRILTGGNVAIEVGTSAGTRSSFAGTLQAERLRFLAAGDVASSARIVVREVTDWEDDGGGPNFAVAGRFAGILTAAFFDAIPDTDSVTVVGGGVANSARLNIGTFAEGDTLVFVGDFRGNLRMLAALTADLVFTGDVNRVMISGEVLSDIVVGGRLRFLNSNSAFVGDGFEGVFGNGSLTETGTLETGRGYLTVVPNASALV